MVKPRRCRRPSGKYLEHRINLRVRFQEIDALGIVWHGHYLTYFEDARVAFGRKYGLGYIDIHNASLAAPIVFVSCDFLGPARFDDELEVVARLYQRDSAKIEFRYEVLLASNGTLLASGSTIQAFVDMEGRLLITMPEVMRVFYERWEKQMLTTHE